jgi:hypothetical protein
MTARGWGLAGGRRSAVAAAATLACWLLVPATAEAGAGIGFTPTFPHDVTVGARGVPAGIDLSNDSDSGEGSMTVCALGDCPELGPSGAGSITLVPSCGVFDTTVSCPPAGADPGVFRISSTPTGRVGSACAGQVFDVTQIDALTGTLRLEPRVGRVVLGPHGAPNDTCNIDFTVDVMKLPRDAYLDRPGIQTLQYGSVGGRTSIRGLLATGRGSSLTNAGLGRPAPAPSAPAAKTAPSTPTTPPSSPAQTTPGSANLSAPTGCVPKPFDAVVRGRRIRRAIFFLDGRQIRVLRRPNRSGSRYALRVNPRRLRVGAHRIVVKLDFTASSRTRRKRLTVVFQRCARNSQAVSPRFTG